MPQPHHRGAGGTDLGERARLCADTRPEVAINALSRWPALAVAILIA